MSSGLLFFISVVAGLVGALSGMGGGVVLIPVLTGCGIDIKRAIPVSVISMIVISNSAASSYVRRHLPNLKVSAFLEIFAVAGSLVGASITLISGRRLLFFLCGGIILSSWIMLWRQRKEIWTPDAAQDSFSHALLLEGSYYDYGEKKTIAYRGRRAYLGGPLMFGAGIISGLLGIGGSSLTVLIHDVVMGLPPKVSLTTSNLIIGVMALAGTSIYLEGGLIDPKLVIPVILGAPLGAWVGSKLLVGFTNRVAHLIFLSILIVLGVEMIIHGIMGIQ